MYRGRFWTMRQYAGFGTAEETNERFKLLLDAGQTGLSTAFDLPTQMGYDSTTAWPRGGGAGGRGDRHPGRHADAAGRHPAGARLHLDDHQRHRVHPPGLLRGGGRRAGDPALAKISGTIQNDILKEYIARGTYVFPVEPSLRLITDIFAFCNAEVPRWNTISISGYHIREAGATAAQEIAFTFANAMEYVKRALDAGLPIERFASRLSFFFASHNDLFEEAAKFRAARRLYARLMRERWGAGDEGCGCASTPRRAGSRSRRSSRSTTWCG
jgi:methylmalonyl-CoA mutase, N-terminal domain